MFPEIVLSLLMLVPGGEHRFYHISVEDGLSQNTVFSVTQDAGGSMWFATYEGVDCFDGYNFYPYRLVNGYEDGKTEHVDTKVLADGDNVVWANTGTLSYFDGSAFVPVPGLSEITVRSFAANPLGGVVLLTDKGFMAARKGAVEKAPGWLAGMKGALAVSSCDSLIAVATDDGRLSVRHALSGMETFSAPFAFCSEISDLLPDSDGVLWAGTYGNGLFRLCGDECRHFQHLRDDGGSLCSNYVKSLCRDGLGHIWIGTGNGLSILDEESLAFENVFYDSAERYGLSHNSVKSVFRDSAGDMWLGTYYGGVNYCHPGASPFERAALSDGGSGSIIGGIAEDSDGTLWIGTSRNGVYHYNPETGTSRHLSLYSDDAEMDDVKAIRFSADGESIYFGTGLGGLNVYSRRNGEVRHFKGDGYPVAVYSILPEGGGRYLWLGSLSGLFLFDVQTGTARLVLPVPDRRLFIYSLYQDRSGLVWIGAESGLVSCRLTVSGTGAAVVSDVMEYPEVSQVQDILQTNGGDIWVATRGGLYRSGEGWRLYNMGDGLSSDIIRGLEADSSGNLWIATENGLDRLDVRTGAVSRFYEEDGLPDDVLNTYAHCLTSSGRMYFGGLRGLFSFDPELLGHPRKESRAPMVSSVLVNGSDAGLHGNSIVLKHYQKSLALNFSVPNYSSWRRDIFLYRLRGAQKNWETAGSSHSVSYSNLRPGHYTFELVSLNADGVRSPESYELDIRLRAVWYRSLAAMVVYALIFALCVILLVRYLIARGTERSKLEIERIRNISAEEVERQKALRFASGAPSKEDADFLVKMLKTVEANMSDEGFGVEQFSSEMCMSRSNLYLKSRSITGVSPLDFIHRVRMEKACELLREGKMSVANVGAAVGFSSPSYFTACFKKFSGVLPGKFR